MIKTYTYKGKTYGAAYEVRRAIEKEENKRFGPSEDTAEFWKKFGVTYTETPEEPAPEPTEEEKQAEAQRRLTEAVQRFLDAEAQKLNYDSCLSVCSYVDTGVTKFDEEGAAFRAWRSAVWAKGYEIVDAVKAGKREVPTEEELFAELPKLSITYSAS